MSAQLLIFGQGWATKNLGHAVDHENTVEMVYLVLDTTGGKIPEGPRELVPRHVFPLNVDFWNTGYRNK
jgi:hypothetical protein